MVVSLALAAVPAGANPENALPADGSATTLNPGASAWYGFVYAGDASPINIALNAQGQSGLAFSVWTPERIAQYEAGQAVDPIGRGAENPDVAGADLFWTGSFDLPGTYHVWVENASADPLGFSLTATGKGVSGLPESAPVLVVAAPAPAAAVPAPAPMAKLGVNPETALAPGTTLLNPGASAWYAFSYAGDASQIDVVLNAQGQSGLAFGVWTPERITQYEAGQAVDPIGRGSENPDIAGADLFWTGNFTIPATYYVWVQNTSSDPIGYTLPVDGSGVW